MGRTKIVNSGLAMILCLMMVISSAAFIMGGLTGDSLIHEEVSGDNGKLDKNLNDVTGTINVMVSVPEDVDMKKISGQLEEAGATIIRTNTASVNYFECRIDAEAINQITAMDDITWVQQIYEPQPLMNNIQSGVFMGIDIPQLDGFKGAGVLAEVVDTGIELSHPDLGSIQYTDFSYYDNMVNHHGTAVSGIMFGDGTGDMDAQGILPEATGVFARYENGNALGLQHLWDGDFSSGNAGQHGVLQTNSWWNGAPMDGEYDAVSNELDQAIVDHPYILTHWAVGNSNFGETEGLISAEASSKNNLAVGSIFHKDTASTADDDWSSNGEGLTPSRGPTADGRVKPDMCGIHDWIYTTDMVGASGYTATDYYDNFGGTSGATPTIAGCSGLAYNMYQENYFDNNPDGNWPYSSTVKALMIANAFQYEMNTNLITRNVQGWGSPDMENMHNLGPDYHVIEEYPMALDSGDSWSRDIYSDGVNPLKISLVWIDPAAPASTVAGRALINNLDLHIISPGGTEYWGNNGLGNALWSSPGTGAQRWSSTASYQDDLNNVENVFIQTPESGIWTVEVQGRTGDMAQGPQDFSMVASGAARISSMGTINLDNAYVLEDTAMISVIDLDLNDDPGSAQTVLISIVSDSDLTGEDLLLTETGPDTNIFENSIILSASIGPSILTISDGDTITATYEDEDDGTGSSNTAIDTAIVDGYVASISGQTVDWWGVTNVNVTSSGIIIGGLQTNGHSFTNDQDDSYAQVTEVPAGSNGRMNFDFQYDIIINPAGVEPYSVYLDAYTSGEEFTATYSTDDGGSWGSLGTITATTDTDTYSTWGITASAGDTVIIHFTGSVKTGEATDTIYLDHMYILGGSIGSPTDHNTINWTLSGDDGAGANDVVQYNIYRADTPIVGAYLDSVPAGTDTYTDLGKGDIDGIQRYYVVRAEDIIGNEDTNTLAVPEPGGASPSAYDIPIGSAAIGDWVFVSFPYAMSGDIATMLNDDGGGDNWDIAKWYDTNDTVNPWKTHSVNNPGLSDMPVMTNSMGVWLHISGIDDGIITTGFTGDYSGSAVGITLQPGWNLVGYPSATGENAFDSLLGLGVNWIGEYQAASPYINDESDLTQVDLSEGNAYWIHVDALTVWTVDP